MDSQSKNYIAELIQLCAQGDTFAFRKLYEQLDQKIFSFLISRVPERADAMDILQDVFVDVWQALRKFTYKSDKQFYAFVFVITKRKVAKFYAGRDITVEFSEQHMSDMYSSPDFEIYTMSKLVNKLKKKYQDVIRLRYWSELSFAEIADYLDINESAAKVRHHRALKQLESLAQKYEK